MEGIENIFSRGTTKNKKATKHDRFSKRWFSRLEPLAEFGAFQSDYRVVSKREKERC